MEPTVLPTNAGRNCVIPPSAPARGAVVQRTRELVEFARRNGYRVDELVEIIEGLGS